MLPKTGNGNLKKRLSVTGQSGLTPLFSLRIANPLTELIRETTMKLSTVKDTFLRLFISLPKYLRTLAFAGVTTFSLGLTVPLAVAQSEQPIEFSQAELDQMLAPIALYPDALLSQVLIASTYPLEIIQADRWVRSNKDLKTEDALKFAENKDWDPSVKALVAFPDILKRMSEDVDWTQRLGDAFLSNEESVMDAVQRLRKRAYASGNLEKAQHISVEQDNNNIIIEPAQERIVYVPVYDTRVVYGNWWWPDYPPVYWSYPNYTYVSGFYWGSSIYLGPTYFYSSLRWSDRRVVVVDRRHYYGPATHFYTGRSIVRFNGSQAWRHDPVHRHGVAYYNNNLRNTYGSHRESYQQDRQYRDQHRDWSRVNRDNIQHPPANNNWNRNNNNRKQDNDRNDRRDHTSPRQFDRSEQVRERLGRDNNGTWRANNNLQVNAPGSTTQAPSFQRQAPGNNPAVNAGNNAEPNREAVLQRRQEQRAANGNEGSRFNQERRQVNSEGTDRRLNPSNNGLRVMEQPNREATPAPQPRTERLERRAEFSPRNESEGRAQQQPRVERANNNPRFSRDRQNDK